MRAAASSRTALASLCNLRGSSAGGWWRRRRTVVTDRQGPCELWGFKFEGGLEPNAYTHALFADFDLAGQK